MLNANGQPFLEHFDNRRDVPQLGRLAIHDFSDDRQIADGYTEDGDAEIICSMG